MRARQGGVMLLVVNARRNDPATENLVSVKPQFKGSQNEKSSWWRKGTMTPSSQAGQPTWLIHAEHCLSDETPRFHAKPELALRPHLGQSLVVQTLGGSRIRGAVTAGWLPGGVTGMARPALAVVVACQARASL
jgi:hypothetical protein